jgi:hypothetical protein
MPLGREHAPCATRFTPVLLTAATVGTILNNIAATAAPAVVRDGFLNHPAILFITYH